MSVDVVPMSGDPRVEDQVEIGFGRFVVAGINVCSVVVGVWVGVVLLSCVFPFTGVAAVVAVGCGGVGEGCGHW